LGGTQNRQAAERKAKQIFENTHDGIFGKKRENLNRIAEKFKFASGPTAFRHPAGKIISIFAYPPDGKKPYGLYTSALPIFFLPLDG